MIDLVELIKNIVHVNCSRGILFMFIDVI